MEIPWCADSPDLSTSLSSELFTPYDQVFFGRAFLLAYQQGHTWAHVLSPEGNVPRPFRGMKKWTPAMVWATVRSIRSMMDQNAPRPEFDGPYHPSCIWVPCKDRSGNLQGLMWRFSDPSKDCPVLDMELVLHPDEIQRVDSSLWGSRTLQQVSRTLLRAELFRNDTYKIRRSWNESSILVDGKRLEGLGPKYPIRQDQLDTVLRAIQSQGVKIPLGEIHDLHREIGTVV